MENDNTTKQAARYLIKRDLDAIPSQARYLLEATQCVNGCAERGTLSLSLIRDVIVQAEDIEARLDRIAVLKDVLGESP